LIEAFGRAFEQKSAPTDALETLAADITRGARTDADKARAVYDWLRKNIRYVAVYVGAGGWVPHDVDWILKNRYGDCKDHVLLMQALLRAVGVQAVPVLVHTAAEYELPELPVARFNHAIVYLPTLQQFTDPTATTIPFGALPWAVSDKPVLVHLASGGALMRTPAFKPDENRLLTKSVWRVDAQGHAQVELAVQTEGAAATELQDQLAQIPPGMSGTAIQRILQASGLRGKGFAQYPAVQRELQQQSFTAQVDIQNLLPNPQAGSLNPHPVVSGLPVYILSNMGSYSANQRDYATLCTPITVREEFELHLDKAFELMRVPEGLALAHEDGIAFRSAYQRDGQVVKGWREFSAQQPRHVCSPEQYASRKAVMNRIAQHLRSNLLFQQP